MKRRSKWVKALVSALLSVVLMVQMTGVAWGDSLSLGLPIISQTPEELCCWACCGTSVCQYYGNLVTVERFIYSAKGTYSRYVAGTLGDVQIGLDDYGLYSSYCPVMLNYSSLKGEIDAGRPVISYAYTFVEYDSETADSTVCGHCVMVTGYLENGPKYRISDSFHTYPEYYSVDSLTIEQAEDNHGASSADPYKLDACLIQICPE